MLKKSVFFIGISLLSNSAIAGGALKYSATHADGTVERIVEVRALSDEKIGAIASYARADGSSSFVEYAVECAPLSYAYLGMVHYEQPATPNLLTVRTASDALLNNELRPVAMIDLGEDSQETSVTALAKAVCA